jgi:hypothetical protein
MPTMSTVPADWHYVATAYEFRINPQSGAVPVEYYHVAFTPPAPLGKLANYHKAVILSDNTSHEETFGAPCLGSTGKFLVSL